MRNSKTILLLSVGALAFINTPIMAQDVLATPSQTEKSSSGSSFFGIFDRPSNDKAAEKEKKSDNEAAAKPKDPAPITSAIPAQSGKYAAPVDPAKLQAMIKENGEQQAAIANNQMNETIGKITNQPTQIFDQPPQPKETAATFPNSVTIKLGNISFSNAELQRIASGTGLSATDITRQCTQIIEGTLSNRAGTGGSFRLSGNEAARSGYDGQLANVSAALSFACRLSAPPVNKGVVIKNADTYVIGVATTQCSPDNGRGSQVTISYAGDGKLSCIIN
jgi:hypothetical protein